MVYTKSGYGLSTSIHDSLHLMDFVNINQRNKRLLQLVLRLIKNNYLHLDIFKAMSSIGTNQMKDVIWRGTNEEESEIEDIYQTLRKNFHYNYQTAFVKFREKEEIPYYNRYADILAVKH